MNVCGKGLEKGEDHVDVTCVCTCARTKGCRTQ